MGWATRRRRRVGGRRRARRVRRDGAGSPEGVGSGATTGRSRCRRRVRGGGRIGAGVGIRSRRGVWQAWVQRSDPAWDPAARASGSGVGRGVGVGRRVRRGIGRGLSDRPGGRSRIQARTAGRPGVRAPTVPATTRSTPNRGPARRLAGRCCRFMLAWSCHGEVVDVHLSMPSTCGSAAWLGGSLRGGDVKCSDSGSSSARLRPVDGWCGWPGRRSPATTRLTVLGKERYRRGADRLSGDDGSRRVVAELAGAAVVDLEEPAVADRGKRATRVLHVGRVEPGHLRVGTVRHVARDAVPRSSLDVCRYLKIASVVRRHSRARYRVWHVEAPGRDLRGRRSRTGRWARRWTCRSCRSTEPCAEVVARGRPGRRLSASTWLARSVPGAAVGLDDGVVAGVAGGRKCRVGDGGATVRRRRTDRCRSRPGQGSG